jgi:hypothetical protein
MKHHKILKSFPGTQDGQHERVEFKEGTIAPLSKGLAAIVVREGWAEPHEPEALADGPHPTLVIEPDAPNELVEEKSEGPAPENKMKKPFKKKAA